MNKLSVEVKNQYIPHPMQLFLVGTQRSDGSPNFGPFCWLSFCWDDELSITLCMDGEKSAKDDIRRTGVFSANLVTEKLMPLTNRLGASSGAAKAAIARQAAVSMGKLLSVPVLMDSPLSYELEVKQTIHLHGSDLFVCRIRNAIVSAELTDNGRTYDLSKTVPIVVSQKNYFGLYEKWSEEVTS